MAGRMHQSRADPLVKGLPGYKSGPAAGRMEFYEIANKATKFMECILVSGVVGLYMTASYISVVRDRSVLASYFIITSFIHYTMILAKSPGSLLDLGNASVMGLCSTCNRIRGNRTRHCHVCNKCYNKRDHHCMLLGRCIAENNMRDFYFCTLFLVAFLLTWLCTKGCKAMTGIVACGALASLSWLSLCIAHDRTSSEMMKVEDRWLRMRHVRSLLRYIGEDLVGALLPVVNTRRKVEY